MSAKRHINADAAVPYAWTLRDEIAMHALTAMVSKGGWGETAPDGTHRNYSTMPEYSRAAYRFADYMFEAREGGNAYD